MLGNDCEKKVSFKFMFKCRQCHWWRHFRRKTVPGFCRQNTAERGLWWGLGLVVRIGRCMVQDVWYRQGTLKQTFT